MIILAKQEVNDFLNNNALYIALGFIALIAIVVVVILLLNRKKNNQNSPEFIKSKEDSFYLTVGGEDNVEQAKLVGSRFVVVLKDPTKLDKDKIKTLGVDNIIALKDKITLVLNEEGKHYFQNFRN